MSGERELLCELRGRAGVITLNRPQAINALDLPMLAGMLAQLRGWAADPRVDVVIVRGAGTRGFCAGGDVRAVHDARGDPLFMDRVYRVEYELDEYISRYPKPYVALMTGIIMGGGCGISVHARHRVVTETTVLAMPEVLIGLFPDVAGTLFLARCPDELGTYLGLTGTRIGGADAIALGLADWYVDSRALDALVDALSKGGDAVSAVAAFVQDPPTSELIELRGEISATFSGSSVTHMLAALEIRGEAWAVAARNAMRSASPTSLEITLRALRNAAGRDIREVLVTDFRIAQRLMLQPDYFEGVRAMVIDKDRSPRWSPASLRNVDPATVDACFAPLGAGYELTFP